MNFVKRTSKREDTLENHTLPHVHVQWKEENQYKNESLFFCLGRRGKRSTLYIFSQFHSLSVEAARYPLSADRYRLSRLAAGCIPKRRAHQTPLLLMYNNIAPAGRHQHPLNLLNPLDPRAKGPSLNPLNPHTEGVSKGKVATTTSEPSKPGTQSGPYSRPLPTRCARHPPPGRGWASSMEERNVAISLAAYGWRGPPKAAL